jgi:hypothetical protein
VTISKQRPVEGLLLLLLLLLLLEEEEEEEEETKDISASLAGSCEGVRIGAPAHRMGVGVCVCVFFVMERRLVLMPVTKRWESMEREATWRWVVREFCERGEWGEEEEEEEEEKGRNGSPPPLPPPPLLLLPPPRATTTTGGGVVASVSLCVCVCVSLSDIISRPSFSHR